MRSFGPRLAALITVALFCAAFVACADDPTPTKPTTLPPGTLAWQFEGENIFQPRAGEFYHLWLRTQEGKWTLLSAISPSRVEKDNRSTISATFETPLSISGFEQAVLSVDSSDTQSAPGLVILTGKLQAAAARLTSVLPTAKQVGTVLFATLSADSNQAKREFYLARKSSAITPSLDLPTPPDGWRYGLWVIDSQFTPTHRFFYGYFSSTHEHDSDSENDAFEIPGGVGRASLESSGSAVRITLEPEFMLSSLPASGQSNISLMYAPLRRYIHLDQELPLLPVTAQPSARVSLSTTRF